MAKIAWDPVLTMLGRDLKLEILDRDPYTGTSPFPWGEQLIRSELRKPRAEVHHLIAEEVVKVHDDMIRVFGGTPGDLDVSRIQSILDRVQHSVVGGKNMLPTVIHKAAFLMHSILLYHPFVDGQKRTGVSSAFIFLGMNGYYLWSRSPLDEVHFAIKVAKGEFEVNEVAKWLSSRIAPDDMVQNPETIKGFLPYAMRRGRQCSVCHKYVRLNAHIVQCNRCNTAYKVKINAALLKGNGKKGRFFVKFGMDMLGTLPLRTAQPAIPPGQLTLDRKL